MATAENFPKFDTSRFSWPTHYTYDPLNQVTTVTEQDGGTISRVRQAAWKADKPRLSSLHPLGPCGITPRPFAKPALF